MLHCTLGPVAALSEPVKSGCISFWNRESVLLLHILDEETLFYLSLCKPGVAPIMLSPWLLVGQDETGLQEVCAAWT